MSGNQVGGIQADLLGEFRVSLDGAELNLGQPRQRAVLAVLAVRSPHSVSRAELIDAVWGEQPPASAEGSLHTYVGALRQLLEPGRGRREPARVLVTTGAGYALEIPPGARDIDRFDAHVRQARALAGSRAFDQAEAEFAAALRLWRGEALAGTPGPFAETQRVRLAEWRMAVIEEHTEIALQLGRHCELVTELTAHVRRNPLRERLCGQLMLALYRCDRQAEALNLFHETRHALVDSLGIEPAPELRQLYEKILARSPVLGLPGTEALAPPPFADAARPAQLPAASPVFAGRQDELTRLGESLRPRDADGQAPVTVVAVDGAGGVGKTTLVVRFAHEIADQFPDGQLFLDLRGFDPYQPPVTPSDALCQLLRGLGVEQAKLPADLDGQVGLYRTALSGKRVLVVLDNAAGSDQVRPLLPGSASCRTLVTSRKQLSGLVARDGARRLSLSVLGEPEGIELLRGLLGGQRVAAEPGAAREILQRCGGLPLAVRVAAAKVAVSDHRLLSDVADELVEAGQRLDVLTAEDDDSSTVRAVLSWSYTALKPEAARLFRLLGLHQTPELGLDAIVALAGLPRAQVRRTVDSLCCDHLLQEISRERYRLHDLLHVYARERADELEPRGERIAAVDRLLRWYLRAADEADRTLVPLRRRSEPVEPPPHCRLPTFDGHRAALAWLDTELPQLVAAPAHAVGFRLAGLGWRFPLTCLGYFHHRTPWQAWLACLESGLAAAEAVEDTCAQAAILSSFVNARRDLGRYAEAEEAAERALVRWREAGDELGEAGTLSNLASVRYERGDVAGSIVHFGQSLAMLRRIVSREGLREAAYTLVAVLHNLAQSHRGLGECVQARECLSEALDIARRFRLRQLEGLVLIGLGATERIVGRLPAAVEHLERALSIQREIEDRRGEADTLIELADLAVRLGEPEAERSRLGAALDLLSAIGDPRSETIAVRLVSTPE